MQSKSITDLVAKEALRETQGRIHAIASVHRRLYTSADVRSVEISEFLSSLLHDLEATMKASGHASTIRLTAEAVEVPTDKAVSIGVIVTELLTNAFKYAYPGDTGGEIRVKFRNTSPGKVTLTVEDDGVGWAGEGPPKGTGLGSRIVTTTARGLGSAVEYLGTRGCRVSLEFAL
jgi:two-component sensor histidine kinase